MRVSLARAAPLLNSCTARRSLICFVSHCSHRQSDRQPLLLALSYCDARVRPRRRPFYDKRTRLYAAEPLCDARLQSGGTATSPKMLLLSAMNVCIAAQNKMERWLLDFAHASHGVLHACSDASTLRSWVFNKTR